MKYYFSLKVPVKNFLKKYIYYQYRGYTRLVITKDNIIGRKLFDLLSNAKNTRYGNQDRKDKFLSFTVLTDALTYRLTRNNNFGRVAPKIEEITFNLTANYMLKECGIWLTETAVIDFNQYVDIMFRKDFRDYVDERGPTQEISERIYDFMEKYKMTDEDLTFE